MASFIFAKEATMELQHLLEQAKTQLLGIQNMNDLNNLKAAYLGKKWEKIGRAHV